MTPTRSLLRALACATLVAPALVAWAMAQQPSVTIEKLLGEGWEVAGYIAAWEDRTLILFKQK